MANVHHIGQHPYRKHFHPHWSSIGQHQSRQDQWTKFSLFGMKWTKQNISRDFSLSPCPTISAVNSTSKTHPKSIHFSPFLLLPCVQAIIFSHLCNCSSILTHFFVSILSFIYIYIVHRAARVFCKTTLNVNFFKKKQWKKRKSNIYWIPAFCTTVHCSFK